MLRNFYGEGNNGAFRKVGKNSSDIITINYNGTFNEWKNIVKGKNWNTGSKIKKVKCSDITADI